MKKVQVCRFGAGWRGMGAMAPMKRSATFFKSSNGLGVRREACGSRNSAASSRLEKQVGM